MPHKHTRRKGGDESNFNLAPSSTVRPLPAYSQSSKPKKQKNSAIKRKRTVEDNGYKHDDTPRAFARMMQLQSSNKRQRSGLDDHAGSKRSNKKRKTNDANDAKKETTSSHKEKSQVVPKILPGERLGDFAARVDQTMSVGNLKRKGNVKIECIKERQTKTEKRLHKMYASWREEDARRKEKLEEQRELEEDAEAELGARPSELENIGRKWKRSSEDDDPWIELNAKREERKGLHDVVQAPPSFKAVPKEKYKVRNGAKIDVENVPSKAGSLKKREELSEARKEIIERYRAMMGKGG